MPTTRSQGVCRKATALAAAGTAVLMVTSEMRDLTLVQDAAITWTMTFSDLAAVNAGSAVWIATPAAANGVVVLNGITPMAIKATASGAATAVACWKS